MCGIAGIQTRDGRPPDPAALARLRTALAHRGPDGSAVLVRGDTGLVHLRLAIVDLETGDQPLLTPDGVALIANGEIYNDPDLRRAMAGTPWRSHSDCEPPAFLFESDGVAFADRLRGMYAIALHHMASGRLVLARDPFGIKPLYYVATDTLFAFASEPQALLAAGLAARAIDATRRNELLQLKFTTGAETIFPGISRVLPGETLVVERGRIALRRTRSGPAARRAAADRLARGGGSAGFGAAGQRDRASARRCAVRAVPLGRHRFGGAADADAPRHGQPHPRADRGLGWRGCRRRERTRRCAWRGSPGPIASGW